MLTPLNRIIIAQKNGRKVVLCRQAPYISIFLFITLTHLLHIFLKIFKRYFIHKLQLYFVNVFIQPIELSCFTSLNYMHSCMSVSDTVDLKYCLEQAANDSDFLSTFDKLQDIIEMTAHSCLEFPLGATYINSFTHEESFTSQLFPGI